MMVQQSCYGFCVHLSERLLERGFYLLLIIASSITLKVKKCVFPRLCALFLFCLNTDMLCLDERFYLKVVI